MLNSLQRLLAITAFGSFAGFVDSLGFQFTTRSSDGSDFVLLCVVRVARISRPAAVRHGGGLVSSVKRGMGGDSIT